MDTITFKSAMVVIKLSSLCKNIVGGEFSTKLKGVWGAKGRVGDCGGTPADNLLYENRNGTGLQSFLQKNNLKNFKILYF